MPLAAARASVNARQYRAPASGEDPHDQLEHRPHLHFHLPHADGVDLHLRRLTLILPL